MLTIQVEYNKEVLNQFALLCRKGRLAHAYLFVGPRYVGKKTTALVIARMLLCQRNQSEVAAGFCGECDSCIKLQTCGHPDVQLLTMLEDSKSIKIGQVRDLLARIQMRSLGGGMKVLVIAEAEYLTMEATNTLLKTLEEPAADTLWILTTTALELIPQTIRSRCHLVHFAPFSKIDLETQLINSFQEDPLSAHYLAFSAEGCLGKALQLREQDCFKRKNEIVDRFILAQDEEYLKIILEDADLEGFLLEVVEGWIRDAILLKSDMDDSRIVNADRLLLLRRFAEKFTFQELWNLYQHIVKTKNIFNENLNIKVALATIQLAMQP